MKLLTALWCLLPLALAAQSWFAEPGIAFRSGIWQYNLGEDNQGRYAGEGLHYSHFSPFLGSYLQGGYEGERFTLGMGLAYTVFFDKELRVNQNRQNGTYLYAISESFIQLFHWYGYGEWHAVRKNGFRLGPCLRAGFFTPTTSFPQQEELQRRRFIEGGLSCLARIGRPWLVVSPAYQWNVISGRETDARHDIFSMGLSVGLRYGLQAE
ncbi:MAG: hypothetical protein KDD10_10050 [Phaeodactylibacter sp.]|nr:hypothetical protein [Phaeodactylibacter sp.]